MTAPRVVLLDIETAPTLAWVWALYQTDVIDVKQDWFILSFAYRWLGTSGRVKVHALPDYLSYRRNPTDDKWLVKDLWAILDEADVVIAHNGDRFDLRKARARFIIHGLPPPTPFKTIDTLKIARRFFKFDSNRLNDLGRYLGVGRKLAHTGYRLWFACMNGDAKAWKLMRRYNARDITLLESVYLALRPWAPSHPDLTLYSRQHSCPTCQSFRLQQRGWNYTKTGKRKRVQCLECGAWSSGRKHFREPIHEVTAHG